MGITPEEAKLHIIHIIASKLYGKTERDDEVLKMAVEALDKEEEPAFWIKYKDILECSNCGFGYYPHDYFFKNHKCVTLNRNKLILSRCPECARKMDKKIKDQK